MKARLLLKVFFWFIVACVATVVGVYLIALYINRHDQPPSAAAVRFEKMSSKQPSVAEKDNGYVYFMGLSAAKESDPVVVGKERITWALAQLALPPAASVADFPGKDRDVLVERPSDIDQLLKKCVVADLACARAFESNEAKIESWLTREKWFAERYGKLLSFPAWRETPQFDTRIPLPTYAGLYELHRMSLLDAWLRAGRGDVDGVKKLLADDIQFWRRNIAQNDSLIAKMISVGALQRHFTWSNIILRRLPASRQAEAIPSEWRVPITEAERSMLRPFVGEWKYFKSKVWLAKAETKQEQVESDDLPDSTLQRILAKHFLQKQATINQQAARMEEAARALSVDYAQLPAAAQRVRRLQENVGAGILEHGLHNLMGNILIGAGGWDTTKYAVKAADLEGTRRAALLTAELRSRSVPAEQVQAQLAASASSPYDGRPFLWDEAGQSIVFTGLADGKFARTSMLY
jgi:hypothetical protein